ncbi:MAG: hypothetical protein WBC44_05875 [Planctomycetaceae bacterium]
MRGDLETVWRDILSNAKGLTPSGEGYDCRCPAHEDQRASLSITRTPEKILLHCHVGCEPARVALEFGYSLSDLGVKRDDGPRKAAAPEASWPVVKAYDYLDTDGILA